MCDVSTFANALKGASLHGMMKGVGVNKLSLALQDADNADFKFGIQRVDPKPASSATGGGQQKPLTGAGGGLTTLK